MSKKTTQVLAPTTFFVETLQFLTKCIQNLVTGNNKSDSPPVNLNTRFPDKDYLPNISHNNFTAGFLEFYPEFDLPHQDMEHNSHTQGVEEAKQEAPKSEDKQEIEHKDLKEEQAQELEEYNKDEEEKEFEENKEDLKQEQDLEDLEEQEEFEDLK